MNRQSILCAAAIGASLAGCGQGFEPVYQVPEDLQAHVETFLEEALARGHGLTLDNLIVAYDPELPFPMCGACNSAAPSNAIQKVVRINPDCPMTYHEQREALLFHELGHCVLSRQHVDDLLPNGDPKSIMIPSNVNLYAPCVYQIGQGNCNFTFKRDYYLDELFDENAPVPEWAILDGR